MLDETVETRRPWRGSPHPCVHAGVFLHFMGIISTVSKPLRYLRFGTVRVHPRCPGLTPLRCGGIMSATVTPRGSVLPGLRLNSIVQCTNIRTLADFT